MGILNLTPDSFYTKSRVNRKDIKERLHKIIDDGADIIDVGGCSTRPGAEMISEEEEWNRIQPALESIKEVDENIPVSVDTFRSSIARKSVENYKVGIINDISGGSLDPDMFETVADLGVAYVLTHMRGTPETMNDFTCYDDITSDIITELSRKLFILRELGVKDVIIDPGFGFAKTIEQNFQLLDELKEIKQMGLPVLAGISRKKMIWKTLDITPEEALTGTICLESIAIDRGADILRVHDVKEAVEIITLTRLLKERKQK